MATKSPALKPSAGESSDTASGGDSSWNDPSLPSHERFKRLQANPDAYTAALGLDKSSFDALPQWKQKKLRQEKHLW